MCGPPWFSAGSLMWFCGGGGGGGGDLLHLFHRASMYYLTEKKASQIRRFPGAGTEGTPLRRKVSFLSIMRIYAIDLYF